MKNGKLPYFYMLSVFFTIFTLLSQIIYASNEEKDLTGKEVSPFIRSMEALLDKRGSIKPLEEDFKIIQFGIDKSIAAPLVSIEEISEVKGTIKETEKKICTAQHIMKDIKKDLSNSVQPLNKSGNLEYLKNLMSLDSFLSAMGLQIYWGMDRKSIEDNIHKAFTYSPSSFSVSYTVNVPYSGSQSYSGSVPYSGSKSYSGSASYNHFLSVIRSKCDSCNEFGPFPTNSNNCSKCDYCGASARNCSHCGKKFPEPTNESHGRWQYAGGENKGKIYKYEEKKTFTGSTSYTVNVPYSGSQSYSGSVPYSGSKSHSGSINATCSEIHHKHLCDNWALIVLSFHEALEERDYYKSSFEKQQILLQNITRKHEEVSEHFSEISGTMGSIHEKTQLVISTVQRDRDHFLGGLEHQKLTVQHAFNFMSMLHESEIGFHNQILRLARGNEEGLQKKLDSKKEKKSISTKKLEVKAEKLEVKADKLQNELIKEKEKEVEYLKEQVEESTILKEKEKEQILLEASLRDFIPNLFLKLCEKSDLEASKIQGYTDVLMDENIPLGQMIKKVKFYIMKEKI